MVAGRRVQVPTPRDRQTQHAFCAGELAFSLQVLPELLEGLEPAGTTASVATSDGSGTTITFLHVLLHFFECEGLPCSLLNLYFLLF